MDAPTDGGHPASADGHAEPGITPNHVAAEKAVLESVSTTLLMPGEDPSSPYLEDAEHWMIVYGELYDFVVEIVGQFDAAMRDLREPAQEYLRSYDMLVHEKQIERFAERLAFWRQRTADFRATPAGSGNSRIAAR